MLDAIGSRSSASLRRPESGLPSSSLKRTEKTGNLRGSLVTPSLEKPRMLLTAEATAARTALDANIRFLFDATTGAAPDKIITEFDRGTQSFMITNKVVDAPTISTYMTANGFGTWPEALSAFIEEYADTVGQDVSSMKAGIEATLKNLLPTVGTDKSGTDAQTTDFATQTWGETKLYIPSFFNSLITAINADDTQRAYFNKLLSESTGGSISSITGSEFISADAATKATVQSVLDKMEAIVFDRITGSDRTSQFYQFASVSESGSCGLDEGLTVEGFSSSISFKELSETNPSGLFSAMRRIETVLRSNGGSIPSEISNIGLASFDSSKVTDPTSLTPEEWASYRLIINTLGKTSGLSETDCIAQLTPAPSVTTQDTTWSAAAIAVGLVLGGVILSGAIIYGRNAYRGAIGNSISIKALDKLSAKTQGISPRVLRKLFDKTESNSLPAEIAKLIGPFLTAYEAQELSVSGSQASSSSEQGPVEVSASDSRIQSPIADAEATSRSGNIREESAAASESDDELGAATDDEDDAKADSASVTPIGTTAAEIGIAETGGKKTTPSPFPIAAREIIIRHTEDSESEAELDLSKIKTSFEEVMTSALEVLRREIRSQIFKARPLISSPIFGSIDYEETTIQTPIEAISSYLETKGLSIASVIPNGSKAIEYFSSETQDIQIRIGDSTTPATGITISVPKFDFVLYSGWMPGLRDADSEFSEHLNRVVKDILQSPTTTGTANILRGYIRRSLQNQYVQLKSGETLPLYSKLSKDLVLDLDLTETERVKLENAIERKFLPHIFDHLINNLISKILGDSVRDYVAKAVAPFAEEGLSDGDIPTRISNALRFENFVQHLLNTATKHLQKPTPSCEYKFGQSEMNELDKIAYLVTPSDIASSGESETASLAQEFAFNIFTAATANGNNNADAFSSRLLYRADLTPDTARRGISQDAEAIEHYIRFLKLGRPGERSNRASSLPRGSATSPITPAGIGRASSASRSMTGTSPTEIRLHHDIEETRNTESLFVRVLKRMSEFSKDDLLTTDRQIIISDELSDVLTTLGNIASLSLRNNSVSTESIVSSSPSPRKSITLRTPGRGGRGGRRPIAASSAAARFRAGALTALFVQRAATSDKQIFSLFKETLRDNFLTHLPASARVSRPAIVSLEKHLALAASSKKSRASKKDVSNGSILSWLGCCSRPTVSKEFDNSWATFGATARITRPEPRVSPTDEFSKGDS